MQIINTHHSYKKEDLNDTRLSFVKTFLKLFFEKTFKQTFKIQKT